MKKHIPTVLSLLSCAALLAVSFPRFSFFPAAFIALVPLLWITREAGIAASFFRGLMASFAGYAAVFYWLYPMLLYNTGSTAQSVFSLSLLCLYLSLYVGLWSGLSAWMRPKFPVAAYFFGSACLWAALEYVRAWLLTGFPWAILGYSQWNFLPAAQIAEWTGVFGVSFLCVFVNLVLAGILIRRKASRMHAAFLAAAAVIVAAGSFRYNAWQSKINGAPAVRVALLQGNIDQYKKWDAVWENEILAVFERLQRRAAAEHPAMIIWPETSVPGYLPGDRRLMDWMEARTKESGTWNIVSAPFADSGGLYNASILFDPAGRIRGAHKKTHLVPFGEYVPLRGYLEPFFGVLNNLGDFRRGIAPVVLSGENWRAGPSICSENFFGRVSRLNAANGATVIVNQTNDAWFFRTAAPWQHFTMNVFRAIETRRPVAVCGNTGVTGAVAASGAVTFAAPVFVEDCYVVDITPHKEITFYTRFGDVFARLCALISLILCGWAFAVKKNADTAC